VAQTRNGALAQQARLAIETKALDGLTLLARGALASQEAREFLSSMPTVESLMPAMDLAVIDTTHPVKASGWPHDDEDP
jgi:hypothetical protein